MAGGGKWWEAPRLSPPPRPESSLWSRWSRRAPWRRRLFALALLALWLLMRGHVDGLYFRSALPCHCRQTLASGPPEQPPPPLLLSSPCAGAAGQPLNGSVRSMVTALRASALPGRTACAHPWHFRLRLQPADLPTDRSVLPVLIKSAVENGARRALLRGSWARREGWEAAVLGADPLFVFLLGEGDEAAQQSVEAESQRFGDIVQASFRDAYLNNTRKTLSGLQWLTGSGLRFREALFLDDDFYLSKRNLGLGLRGLAAEGEGLGRWLLAGEVRVGTVPERGWSKWRVSEAAFSGDVYPPFVAAGAYLVSRVAAAELFLASFLVPAFVFDDVYMGILTEALGRSPTGFPGVKISKAQVEMGVEWLFWRKLLYFGGFVAQHGAGDSPALIAAAQAAERSWTRQCAEEC